MSIEVTWNEVSSASIPGITLTNPVRQLLGDFRGSLETIPGRRGSWHFPEVRGRRRIAVSGFVLADSFPTARRASVEALADWLDLDIEARLSISDEPGVYYEAVLGDCGDVTEWRELGTFELEWFAYPYAFDYDITDLQFVGNIDFTELFWNPGVNVPLYPVITIQPTNGTMTSFDLSINGETLSWSGLVLDDQILTINGISATVTSGPNTDTELTGAYDSSQLSMQGVAGVFPTLVPGVNPISLNASGTATLATVHVLYRQQYRK